MSKLLVLHSARSLPLVPIRSASINHYYLIFEKETTETIQSSSPKNPTNTCSSKAIIFEQLQYIQSTTARGGIKHSAIHIHSSNSGVEQECQSSYNYNGFIIMMMLKLIYGIMIVLSKTIWLIYEEATCRKSVAILY